MNAVEEDSEWDDDDYNEEDSDRSMGLDAQSFRSVTLLKSKT